MKWLNNLNIQGKLIYGFALVILLSALMAVFSVSSINNVDNKYDVLFNAPSKRALSSLDAIGEFTNAKMLVFSMGFNAGNENALYKNYDELKKTIDEFLENIDEYISATEIDPFLSEDDKRERLAKINTAKADCTNVFMEYAEKVYFAALDNAADQIEKTIEDMEPTAAGIVNLLDELKDTAVDVMEDTSNSITKEAEGIIYLVIGLAVVILIISLIIALVISSIISSQLKKIEYAVVEVSSGNLNVSVRSNNKDEIGVLSNGIANIIDIFNNLLHEINATANSFELGDTEARIDSDHFVGEYNRIATAINKTFDGLVDDTLTAIDSVAEYGRGNFDVRVKRMPGKKAKIHETFDSVTTNLMSVNDDINKLINAVINGNLTEKADANAYSGDWKKMVNGLNDLLAAVNQPIKEISDTLIQVSKANLNAKVTGVYKGQYATMKDALNLTVDNTSSYIHEISDILRKMSEHDLNIYIQREYIGDFGVIKSALEKIIDSFNQIIGSISETSLQVSEGANQISVSSNDLSYTSSAQASSSEELSTSISVIAQKTLDNAENANKADLLTDETRKSGINSNEEMTKMLASMEDINTASNNIKSIIKVIEDIAFQTNLLALNAAVEAARAGVHGAGFTVVAEQVRNLASQSQTAARQTTELIENSITIVSDGRKTADTTAASLRDILANVDQISELISEVATSSDEQSTLINQINNGISEITQSIQTNTSSAEASAATAEELASQSVVLKEIVMDFVLRK